MRRLSFIVLALILAAATLGAYFPALRGGFVWDDDSWTTNVESLLKDGSGLWRLWTQLTALQQYYPLTGTSFWLDHQLWGNWTLPYHVENVLLHVLSAILLWRLLSRLKVPGAMLAAGIFALHPVMVESVAWITERKNVLSMPFFLGAVLAYGRFADFWSAGDDANTANSRKRSYWLALLLFLCALLAKITAFALPVVLLILAWWKREKLQWRRDVWPTLPFFGLAAVLGAVVMWLELHHVGAEGADFALPLTHRIIVAGRALWFYPMQLLWPKRLCFVYPQWNIDPASPWQWLWPAGAAAALWTVWHFRGRLGRGPVAALAFYVVTLAPVMGLMNAYGMVYSFVWDHWVYLPSLGLIALGSGLGMRLLGLAKPLERVVGLVAAAAVLTVFGYRTCTEAAQYRDVETLWRSTLWRNPGCWMAWHNLGTVRLKLGYRGEAIACFERALSIHPLFTKAHTNLGVVFLSEGRLQEAISQFRKVLEIAPDHPSAHDNLAHALLLNNDFAEAADEYETVLRLQPGFANAHINLGNALLSLGRLDEAMSHYRRALEIDPGDAKAWHNLGTALQQGGKFDEAAASYQKAVDLQPDYLEAHRSLATTLLHLGRRNDAMAHYMKAVEIEPSDADALHGVGVMLYEEGRFAEAIPALEKALKRAPTQAGIHHDLGHALMMNHQPRTAVAEFRNALRINPKILDAWQSLGWLLAVCPEASVRDGPEAVNAAQHANELAGGKDATVLATLAAAHAESGDYTSAIQAAEQAIKQASASGNATLADAIRGQLQSYRSGIPLRDPRLGASTPAG